jgi:hypothetical protein
VSDADKNPFEVIFELYAARLNDAPGASRLARLSRSAKRIPAPLLARLTELVVEIDDPQFVGDDIAVHLFDVSHCDAKCANATAFVSALGERLQRYLDNDLAAERARGVLRERAAWWKMALSRAGELCRWPAIVLMKTTDHRAEQHRRS